MLVAMSVGANLKRLGQQRFQLFGLCEEVSLQHLWRGTQPLGYTGFGLQGVTGDDHLVVFPCLLFK